MRTSLRVGLTVGLLLSLCSLGLLARGTAGGDAAPLQLQLADILYSRSQYRAALSVYRSVADNQEEEVSLRTRGRIGVVRSALRVAEFHVAAAQASAIQQAAPGDAAALAVVGDAFWAAGHFSDAERRYREAATLDPRAFRGRHGLAMVLAARGQFEEALNHVRAAIAAAPADPELHATEGSILERMHRFEEAARAYSHFLEVAPPTWHKESLSFIRGQVSFLKSFGSQPAVHVSFKNGSDVEVIPFRMVKGKVIVRARVNGSDPLDFTLDTGAEHTVITAKTARRLDIPSMGQTLAAGVGIVGLRGVERTRLDSLQIGAVEVKNLPCLIKNPPIEGLPMGEAEGLSPIALGLSMSIDYARHQVTIARRLPERPADIEMPLWRHRLAAVAGQVNGMPASFIVDTGGEVISLNTETARFLFVPADRRRIALRVWGTSGLDPEAYLLPGVQLSFDRERLPSHSVAVINLRAPSVLLGYHIGGIVGHQFLSRYRVDFDLERSVLRLTKL